MTELPRSHAELRAAVILAGKEIRRLELAFDPIAIAYCWLRDGVPLSVS
jgi:hypothetical protein